MRRVRTRTWPAGTLLRRGHKRTHRDPAALAPATGDTRFAPLPGVRHTYVAATTFAALLESAFHDVDPAHPRLPVAVLTQWAEAQVELRSEVRLVDLRDAELQRLGLDRSALVTTSPAHYPCTRVWAHTLHGRRIGGHPTHGVVWHSRQTEIRARAVTARPALRELIDTHPAEVAVIWAPPAPPALLRATGEGLGRLDRGEGDRYVADLVALLGIVSQP